MPAHPKTSENAKIAVAVLKLAGTKGWAHVSLDSVAKTAKISAAKLKHTLTSLYDLIPLLVETLDHEAWGGVRSPSGAPRDVLFDLLMARFDVLQKHRKAILSIADAARGDRALSCALLRAGGKSLYRLIEVAKLKEAPPRPLLAAGLAVVYGWAFFVWRGDTSRDMAKTMAALDRALRGAGKAAAFFLPPHA